MTIFSNNYTPSFTMIRLASVVRVMQDELMKKILIPLALLILTAPMEILGHPIANEKVAESCAARE